MPKTSPKTGPKTKLSPERVIEGAVKLADRIGVEAMTIRKIAEEIDAKPMTIYHHVPNKEAIIDGMVDLVFSEIELPPTELGWREAIVVRSRSMREALTRHPWAAPLMESRETPGMDTLRHHDAVIGCFRNAGFSLELTGHAYATIDAFLYGFALEEAALPAGGGGTEFSELAKSIAEQMPRDLLPHLTEFTIEHALQPGYDYGNEFEFGLNLILEGIEQASLSDG